MQQGLPMHLLLQLLWQQQQHVRQDGLPELRKLSSSSSSRKTHSS